MNVSAKGDYAVRAVTGLAARHPGRASVHELAAEFDMPRKFLEVVLADLRRAGIVGSTRGVEGGYTLRRAPSEITVGEVLRVIDGPLANIRGLRPDEVNYTEGLEHVQELWIAARSAVRSVFDEVTFDQLVSGAFAPGIAALFAPPEAWKSQFAKPPAPERKTK